MQLSLDFNQRWTEKVASYRPAGELIRTSEYDVQPIASDKVAKTFVRTHHYSGTYPAARFRFGLYRKAELVGVAVFSHPVNNKTLTSVFGGEATDAVELGRFVLLDSVPGNGETWFLARAFEALREHVRGVVSFSDDAPRTTIQGRTVHPGHVGTIYQAHNARYLGRGSRATLKLLPDGRVFSGRAAAKIRARSKGWEYASAQLEAHGADPLEDQDGAAWLAYWLPRLTRPLKHPGNHKYAWGLSKREHKRLPASRKYPKLATSLAN